MLLWYSEHKRAIFKAKPAISSKSTKIVGATPARQNKTNFQLILLIEFRGFLRQ